MFDFVRGGGGTNQDENILQVGALGKSPPAAPSASRGRQSKAVGAGDMMVTILVCRRGDVQARCER